MRRRGHSFRLTLVTVCALLGTLALPSEANARKLNVVTSTTDMAALTQDVTARKPEQSARADDLAERHRLTSCTRRSVSP